MLYMNVRMTVILKEFGNSKIKMREINTLLRTLNRGTDVDNDDSPVLYATPKQSRAEINAANTIRDLKTAGWLQVHRTSSSTSPVVENIPDATP